MARLKAYAKPAGFIAFLLIVVSGVVVIVGDTHGFGPSATTTTVIVKKGNEASRQVILRTPSGRISRTERPGAPGGLPPTAPNARQEQPKGQFARQKTTTESHHKSFLESLIGDDGLIFLQAGAVLIAAFIGAAIFQRVLAGNYRFKVGAFDFSFEETTKETTAFVVALRDSVAAINVKLEELEQAAPKTSASTAQAVQVPLAGPFIDRVASAASNALPDSNTTELKQAIEIRRDELTPEPQPETSRPTETRQPSEKADDADTTKDETAGAGTVEQASVPVDAVGEQPPTSVPFDEMEELLRFVPEDTSRRQDPHFALVYATLSRSAHTYRAICRLLRDASPVQAGMLIGSLSEDVALTDLLIDPEDQAKTVERVLEERDSAEAWRKFVDEKYTFAAPDKSPGGSARARIDVPGEEEEWPGIARLLPNVTTSGEKKFMPELQKIISDWLADLSRPSVVSLPFIPVGDSRIELQADPTDLIAFTAAWLFALQVYQQARFDHASADEIKEIDRVWSDVLPKLGLPVVGTDDAASLLDQWKEQFSPGTHTNVTAP